MAAYVKILEGCCINEKLKVCIEKFKHTFEDFTFDPRKKYFVQTKDDKYVKCKVIFLEPSQEELEKKISTARQKIIPDSLLQTATDSELDDIKVKRTKSDLSQTETKKQKLLKYSSCLTNKMKSISSNSKDLSMHLPNDVTTNGEGTNDACDINKQINIAENLEFASNLNSTFIEGDTELQTVDLTIAPVATSQESVYSDNRSEIDTTNTTASKQVDENVPNNELKKVDVIANKINTTNNKQDSTKSKKGKDSTPVEQRSSKQTSNTKKKAGTSTNISCTDLRAQKMRQEKCDDSTNYKGKYYKMKAEKEEYQKKFDEVYKINIRLQTEILDKGKERLAILIAIGNQLTQAISKASTSTEVSPSDNFAPVGFYVEASDSFHVGRNVKLSNTQYNNVLVKSKTPGTCVGSILSAVFGESVLLKSTRTGRCSNRTVNTKEKESNLEEGSGSSTKTGRSSDTSLNSKQKDSDLVEGSGSGTSTVQPSNSKQKEKKESDFIPLDPVKLNACEDFYSFWLRTVWMVKNKKTELQYVLELSKFSQYVSKKISYLKAPAKEHDSKPKPKPKPKGKKRKNDELDGDGESQDESEDELKPKKRKNKEKAKNDDQSEEQESEGELHQNSDRIEKNTGEISDGDDRTLSEDDTEMYTDTD